MTLTLSHCLSLYSGKCDTHTRVSFFSMLWCLIVQEALDDKMYRKMFICGNDIKLHHYLGRNLWTWTTNEPFQCSFSGRVNFNTCWQQFSWTVTGVFTVITSVVLLVWDNHESAFYTFWIKADKQLTYCRASMATYNLFHHRFQSTEEQ